MAMTTSKRFSSPTLESACDGDTSHLVMRKQPNITLILAASFEALNKTRFLSVRLMKMMLPTLDDVSSRESTHLCFWLTTYSH
jgi:hypothetical protein